MPSAVEIPSLVAEKATLYRTTDPLLKRLRLEDPYGRPIDTIAKDFEGKEVIIFFVGSAHGDGESGFRAIFYRGITNAATLKLPSNHYTM
jgi:hypothetical protein